MVNVNPWALASVNALAFFCLFSWYHVDMGASSATELYRFNEDDQCSTYDSFTHLSYYDDECMVAGLEKFNRSMRNELFDHLRSKDVKWLRYTHKKRKRMIYLGD